MGSKKAEQSNRLDRSIAHTRGPWVAVEWSGGWTVYGGRLAATAGVEVARVEPNGEFARHDADARLIAAAPDLLAACERVIDALKDHVLIASSPDGAQTQGREICSLLNAAIKKARGQ